jgi:hypothetical protein
MNGLSPTRGAARLRTKVASVVLLVAMVSAGGVATMAGPASALGSPPHPRCAPGTYWDGSDCVPNPPPSPPAIWGLVPNFGWGGDPVTIFGTGLAGATNVTFAGLPVTSFSASDGDIATTVPAGITWHDYGGTQIPVTVITPTGTLTASYTVSPTLSRIDNASWTTSDGVSTSTTSISLDRLSGFLNGGKTNLRNMMRWSALAVKVSVLFADADGNMVGYTNPYEVTASPCTFILCSDGTIASVALPGLVISPNAGVALGVHAIQIIQVRDPNGELNATLAYYASAGMKLADVLIQIYGSFH